MSNLIERLRTERSVYDAELADEAADEIERLRSVLEDYAAGYPYPDKAEEALKNSEQEQANEQ